MHVECYRQISEPLPPPVDIQTSCDLVVWRNAPNISYEDITGYMIQLIISDVEKVNISDYVRIYFVDASATFYSLDGLDETLKSESTFIQVRLSLWLLTLRAILFMITYRLA